MSKHAKPREGREGPGRTKVWLLLIQLVIGAWNHF